MNSLKSFLMLQGYLVKIKEDPKHKHIMFGPGYVVLNTSAYNALIEEKEVVYEMKKKPVPKPKPAKKAVSKPKTKKK